MGLKAIVIGATGLIGTELVTQLLNDDNYESVKVLHRRSTGVQHSKYIEHIIDFEDPKTFEKLLAGDVVFSAMGTTIKKAGSKDAQYKVDVEYPFSVAKVASLSGVSTCVLVSSAGANASSSNFYTRIKGELDEMVFNLDFDKVRIMRPSILDGDRNEFRLGESIGIQVMRILRFIPGLRKYRPIHASIVARAMRNSLDEEGDVNIYALESIFKLAK